jgi:hypothetical protein
VMRWTYVLQYPVFTVGGILLGYFGNPTIICFKAALVRSISVL